jgi:hypothetical protein
MAATKADPKLADAQYALAAIYASGGEATLSLAHAEKYLGLTGDPKGVTDRIAKDTDFDKARASAGFRAWLATLAPSSKTTQRAAGPKPKAKKPRKPKAKKPGKPKATRAAKKAAPPPAKATTPAAKATTPAAKATTPAAKATTPAASPKKNSSVVTIPDF